MIKKGSKLYSVLTGTCPKCHEESMYVNPNPFALMDILKIRERCSNCNTRYRMEPSFFFGAMYVSYGVGVAFSVAAFIISFLILGLSLTTSFIVIIVTLIIFMPFIMRVSRNIWINLFMNYDERLAKKQDSKDRV
ncbi:DUF983 domain-containing protein [Gelidibacter gilvus]|uniref:DUF983 domain-containing protein n=2 Tax=Gelidibacter maritimus TaxID=2761487 RepID=A0A7W2M5V5_9FLAO|nr:DUF983 domain-containing protein [Gelidibacter maritimus]MBA6153264.1 DUF983 domain-containing protein [Gelidibacter maritimus]